MSELHYCSLNHFTVVSITGPDSGAFLGAQLTSDLPTLPAPAVTLSGYCNPKGRLIATFWLIARDSGYCLVLPSSMAELLAARLKRFVLRSKVAIEVDSITRPFGLLGEDWHGVSVTQPIYRMNDSHRYLLLTHQTSDIAPEIIQHGAEIAESRWHARGIADRIAMVFPETSEMFVPQHVGLENTGAVSFTKGCYPGQEVVARLHYLGRSKQTMVVANTTADGVRPGMAVYADHDLLEKAGTVIEAQSAGPRVFIVGMALAVGHTQHQVWFEIDGTAAAADIITSG